MRFEVSRFEIRGESANLLVEGEEDCGGEWLAAQSLRRVGQLSTQRGGDGVKFGRKAGVVDVDPNADDGVAKGGGLRERCGVGCGLDEDTAALAGVEEEVVGPTDVYLVATAESRDGRDGRLHRDSGGEREAEGVLHCDRRCDERGHVEAGWLQWSARCGVPRVTAAAPARGLFVGDPDAVARAGLRCLKRKVVGGG